MREVFARLYRGSAQTLGFAALGLVVAAASYFFSNPFASAPTSMRVSFAFSGFEKGQYPDHSKFQPYDMCAPDIIVEALKRQGLDTSEDFQNRVRAALSIEGIIPPDIIRERDRLQSAGQTPGPYRTDEYLVTLAQPRGTQLGGRQRELLLNEIVGAYQGKFQRTYAEVPQAFGNAFESLRSADYYEYELILDSEIQNITAFLNQQLDQARTFRSPTTNLSFSDLLNQTESFSQIRFNETLGLIRQNGLSSNRAIAMVKMNYYLRTLEDQEERAVEEAKVVDGLLAKAQERSQNYVLGIKSQVARQQTETPLLDQGLIDSLLANDAYNFLVRRTLDAGLAVKRIQAEKERLLERRKVMDGFLTSKSEDQSAIIMLVQKSLTELEAAYKDLISNIRKTQADFARQQFAGAIRISRQPVTGSRLGPLAMAGAVGGFIGLAFGLGLNLLGIHIGGRRE